MKALVVQHDHVSPTGPVGRRLEHHGFEITEFLVVPETSFREPNVAVEFPDPLEFDLVVFLGAPGGLARVDEFDGRLRMRPREQRCRDNRGR